MKKQSWNIMMAVATAGVWILSASGVMGQTADPIGPPKPVTVVNTISNPVPVIGTINGSVTGSVSVTNSPTVKIDSTANKVQFDPRSTALLINTGKYDVSTGGYPALGAFDVSGYSRVRVLAFNYSDSEGPFSISALDGNFLPLDDTGRVTLQPGQVFSRVYDLPGQLLRISVGGNGPNRNGQIVVYAR